MTPEEIANLVRDLEDEVNNGGFHQYFFNSSGDMTIETINALQIIEAFYVADILKRAIERFPEKLVPKERSARLKTLRENFPTAKEFNDLDAEFFAYPDDISALLAKYGNEH